MGAAPGGPVAADGTFKLDNVPPGEYRVTIPSMPDYYVKQISFDRNDALNSPFVVPEASTQTGALEIVLSSKVGQIEGVVTDERGQAVTGIQAVLVPDSNRDRTDLFKAITTDQTGRFVMKGIPPGDYKLYAWDALENYGYFDPDLLKRSEPLGKGIRVNESDNRIVDLKMIPAGETP
jgi:protocatechuate 3,4-dioxygenase beta subunit